MPRLPHPRRTVPGCLLALVVAGAVGIGRTDPQAAPAEAGAPPAQVDVAPPAQAQAAPPAEASVPAAAPAPPGLPTIEYGRGPRGFPADPASASLAAVTEGVRPRRKLAVYDAPGGRPRAFLPRTISGLPVVVPIVARRPGWVAVLLPSVNRRVGWLPATGWYALRLRDQLVLRRRAHELIWLRDGRRRQSWTVAVGTRLTPTPLGRTFVLGRTGTRGAVYAGLDALVLATVPEDRRALPPALRGAHTGIHGWSDAAAFGRSVSNGCVRLPARAQRTLLAHLAPGTPVHIAD